MNIMTYFKMTITTQVTEYVVFIERLKISALFSMAIQKGNKM